MYLCIFARLLCTSVYFFFNLVLFCFFVTFLVTANYSVQTLIFVSKHIFCNILLKLGQEINISETQHRDLDKTTEHVLQRTLIKADDVRLVKVLHPVNRQNKWFYLLKLIVLEWQFIFLIILLYDEYT